MPGIRRALYVRPQNFRRNTHGRPLPDKAIDVIDEAAARLRVKSQAVEMLPIEVRDIENVVASISKVPAHSVSANDRAQLADLEKNLKSVIFGQEQSARKLRLCHQDGSLRFRKSR
jgi:ATP-dependent Clp protease ATP-binding subunit ClpA